MDQSTCLPTFLQSEHRTPQREHSTLLQQEHRTLLPALWQSLAEHPDAAAVYWQEQCIDRRTLLQKCQALARLLGAHGIGNGSRIAVLLPRSPDMLVVLLALWQRGAVYVPLDTAWPRARLEAALTLCAAQCLLTTASLQPLWERCDCPPLLLEPIDYRNTGLLSDDNSAALPCDAADPAYLLFTSGSSGTPKAVQINHGSLLTLFAGGEQQIGRISNAARPGWPAAPHGSRSSRRGAGHTCPVATVIAGPCGCKPAKTAAGYRYRRSTAHRHRATAAGACPCALESVRPHRVHRVEQRQARVAG